MNATAETIKFVDYGSMEELPELWAARAGLMASNAVKLGLAGAMGASAKAKIESQVMMDCALSLKKRWSAFQRQPFELTVQCVHCGKDVELTAGAYNAAGDVVMAWIRECRSMCRECLEEKSEVRSQLSEVSQQESEVSQPLNREP